MGIKTFAFSKIKLYQIIWLVYSKVRHPSGVMSSPYPQPTPSQGHPSEVEQLKLANHYLRVALDQTQEGVIMVNAEPLDGTGPRVLYSNVPIACLVGVEPGKGLRGLHLCDLVRTERDAVALLGALRDAADSGSAQCVASLQTFYKTGAKPCLWRVRALHDSMKKLLNFTITVKEQPVTDPAKPADGTAFLHQKEEDLDAISERLRVENLAALAQGFAHDVNNLLGPILAQMSLVLPGLDKETELGQTLDRVLTAARRAKEYTQQIVRMAKARPAERAPTDIREHVRDTVMLSRSGSNVEIRMSLPEDINHAVCDPVKITQVLQNLIFNGIQAMPSGGYMEVELRNVELGLGQDSKLRPGSYVEISVRDRGTGISPENMERLFRDNFTTKADGNGIGLTTCMLFVNQHEGDIRVTSTVNVGTEFKVYLPAVKPPLENIRTGLPTTALKKPEGRPALIAGQGSMLVVDDDFAIRKVALNILKRCGYLGFECESGELGVKTYLQALRAGRPFDAVFMDMRLGGGMSGMEAAQEIWAVDPTARIIISSGSVTPEVQSTFVGQGFFAVLPKPYEASEFSEVAHRATTEPRGMTA
jgi:signal transduction histidine kinase/ActR/RegA family two-component response regulator